MKEDHSLEEGKEIGDYKYSPRGSEMDWKSETCERKEIVHGLVTS
jgi:hypothetical protein